MKQKTPEKMNEHINYASNGKHFLAHLIDCLIGFVLSMLLFFLVLYPTLFKSVGGESAFKNAWRFESDCGLYVIKDSQEVQILPYDGNEDYQTASIIESDNYETYYNALWYYYTDFRANDERADPLLVLNEEGVGVNAARDDYFVHFETKLLKLPAVSTITDPTDAAQLQGESKYFRYDLDEGGQPDIHKKPVLADPATPAADVLKFFFNAEDSTGIYVDTLQEFLGESYINACSDAYNKALWVTLLVSFFPVHVVLFYIVPVCTKRSKTIGKYILRLSVAEFAGFYMKPWKRFTRQGVTLFVTSLRLGVLGMAMTFVGLRSLATISIPLLMGYVALAGISFIKLSMGNSHQSLHDKVFRTAVIADKDSMLFNSYEEYEAYGRSHTDEFPEFLIGHQPEFRMDEVKDPMEDLSQEAGETEGKEDQPSVLGKDINLHVEE